MSQETKEPVVDPIQKLLDFYSSAIAAAPSWLRQKIQQAGATGNEGKVLAEIDAAVSFEGGDVANHVYRDVDRENRVAAYQKLKEGKQHPHEQESLIAMGGGVSEASLCTFGPSSTPDAGAQKSGPDGPSYT